MAVLSDTVSHGQHACGIVGSGSERLGMVAGFVRSGLAAGDRVWCFPNGRRSEVLERLRRDDVGGDDAVARGQLSVVPTHQSTLSGLGSDPDRVIDDLRRAVGDALGDGWNGFRMIGDLGWATRGTASAQHLMAFENRVGEVLAGSPAATLCQYDRYRFDPDTMVALTGAHVALVGKVKTPVSEELRISPLAGLPGLRLAGEIDLSTRDLLIAALDTVPNGAGDLHLELSDLTFIDNGGVQVILRAAERLGPGSRMVLYRPPRLMTMALRLCGDVSYLIEVA
ncbi:MAG: MEDS domain-containing protein [Pseudonocardiaceae bacterium]